MKLKQNSLNVCVMKLLIYIHEIVEMEVLVKQIAELNAISLLTQTFPAISKSYSCLQFTHACNLHTVTYRSKSAL